MNCFEICKRCWEASYDGVHPEPWDLVAGNIMASCPPSIITVSSDPSFPEMAKGKYPPKWCPYSTEIVILKDEEIEPQTLPSGAF